MRKTELPDIEIRGQHYADRGYCYTAGYDGPTIHTTYCTLGDSWGDTAVSSSQCIRSDQDGAAIAARRRADADRRRFTPPEYREPYPGTRRREPGPVIRVDRKQATEVLALRGRPRGTEHWSTWETYVDRDHSTFQASIRTMSERPKPKEMTAQEARAIVEEFTHRVPAYEFKIVRARLVIEEEPVA